jgi:hypothetical protein
LDALIDNCRIWDPVPPSVANECRKRDEIYQLEAILWGEDSVKQLGANTVKAMPGIIIHGRREDKCATNSHGLHAILQALRIIENMFRRSCVIYEIVTLPVSGRDLDIQIVDDRASLEAAVVERVHPVRAQCLKK